MSQVIELHHVLAAPAERVYRAFIDADAVAKWLPPDGFTCRVHAWEAKVGGARSLSFQHFSAAVGHRFGGPFLELVPGERVRYLDRFDDPALPGDMTLDVRLRVVAVGTDLTIRQSGVPDALPAAGCYLGWQQSLRNLARLVEHDLR